MLDRWEVRLANGRTVAVVWSAVQARQIMREMKRRAYVLGIVYGPQGLTLQAWRR